MAYAQNSIFALGNLSHAYLEFDRSGASDARTLIAAAAHLVEPSTTMGGVNLVTGIRPELWRDAVGADAPEGIRGFDTAVVGPDGYTMPATQHDIALWIAGGSYDVIFDATTLMVNSLRPAAALATETVGWSYHRDLDLTGFIDGTENPPLAQAPGYVLIPDGSPGAGGTIWLLQKWAHDAAAWTALQIDEQERVIGRRKSDSEELDDRPTTSHVARTDQDDFGKIFRRNTAYGSVTDHGTMFVGFARDQRFLASMLESMAGALGDRDALTRYTRALTGAYYFVPSFDDLARFA
ncbi:MAG TPA: Dyp-type peroxidase [Jatrophihabitantaceae bacterium]|nr:Dyp-type peroxidase [Jatrophihabitantaceae bacterium]